MRHSRRDESSNRESVFERPKHLDALVASVAGGGTYKDDGDDDEGDMMSYDRRFRGSVDEDQAAALEEAEREAEVCRPTLARASFH